MSSRIKPTRSFLQILVWWAAVTVCLAQTASPVPSPAEGTLLRMTNTARSEQGLAPLKWDDALAQAARTHADLLLQNGQLSHQFPGEPGLALRVARAGAHFQVVAENVAEGPGIDSLQREWMHSSPHRANILDPGLNAVGFGVVQRGDVFYAVADFARAVSNLSYDQVESAVAKLLVAEGVQTGGPTVDARETCEMNHGAAGGSSPRFVMRWQSADLSELPAALEEKLRTKTYHTAAVGACSSVNAESGFTTYRVAVLLY